MITIKRNSRPYIRWITGTLSASLLFTQVLTSTSFAFVANRYSTTVNSFINYENNAKTKTLKDITLISDMELDLFTDVNEIYELYSKDVIRVIPKEIYSDKGEIFIIAQGTRKVKVPKEFGNSYTLKYTVEVYDDIGNIKNAESILRRINVIDKTINSDTKKNNANNADNANKSTENNGSEIDKKTNDDKENKPKEKPDFNDIEIATPSEPKELPKESTEPSSSNAEKPKETETKSQETSIKETSKREVSPKETSVKETSIKGTSNQGGTLPKTSTISPQSRGSVEISTNAEIQSTESESTEDESTSESLSDNTKPKKLLLPKVKSEELLEATHKSSKNLGYISDVFNGSVSYNASNLEENFSGVFLELKLPMEVLDKDIKKDTSEINGFQVLNNSNIIKDIEYRKEALTDGKKYIVARVYLNTIEKGTFGNIIYQIKFEKNRKIPKGYKLPVKAVFYNKDSEDFLILEDVNYYVNYDSENLQEYIVGSDLEDEEVVALGGEGNKNFIEKPKDIVFMWKLDLALEKEDSLKRQIFEKAVIEKTIPRYKDKDTQKEDYASFSKEDNSGWEVAEVDENGKPTKVRFEVSVLDTDNTGIQKELENVKLKLKFPLATTKNNKTDLLNSKTSLKLYQYTILSDENAKTNFSTINTDFAFRLKKVDIKKKDKSNEINTTSKVKQNSDEENKSEETKTVIEDENNVLVKEDVEEIEKPEEKISEIKKPNKKSYKKQVLRDIKVEKKWIGDVLHKDKRPTKVVVELFRTDEEDVREKVDEITITNPGNFSDVWSGKFKDVAVYDDFGNEYIYEYILKDTGTKDLANYVALEPIISSERVVFNSRYNPINLNAKIIWNDNKNEHQVRPTSVKINFERSIDGINFEELKSNLTIDSSWNYNLGQYPRYDKFGNEYIYRIVELDSDNLKNYPQTLDTDFGETPNRVSSQDNEELTITNEIQEIDIPVRIVWRDNNKEELRPKEVNILLIRNGLTTKKTYSKAVSGTEDIWKTTFSGLIKYDELGNEFNYDFMLNNFVGLGNYNVISRFETFGVRTIISSLKLTSHKVRVLWDKGNTNDDKVLVKLYQRELGSSFDKIYSQVPVFVGSEYTFDELPAFNENGIKYIYTARLDDKLYNYKTNYIDENDTTTISNKFISKDLKVNFVWEGFDETNKPKNIYLKLKSSTVSSTTKDVEGKAVNISTDNDTYTFEDLPVFDQNGETLIYSVEQINLNGLRVPIYEENKDEITIINHLGKNIINVKIDWVDNNNINNTRPEFISLVLRRRTLGSKSEVVKEEFKISTENTSGTASIATVMRNSWTYSFGEMPMKSPNGEQYEYDVLQVSNSSMSNYNNASSVTRAKKQEDGTFVISNVLDEVKLPVRITWENDSKRAKRPSKVELTLARYIENVKDENFMRNLYIDSSSWQGTFYNLPKFTNDGKKYEYRIEERYVDTLANYDISKAEFINGEYVVKNTYKGININVISKWDDNLDKLGLRPDEVKLTLTRRVANAGNGEVRDFVKVDESEYVLNKLDKSDLNIWIYTLEGLPKYDSLGGKYEYSLQDYGSGSKTFANYETSISTFENNSIVVNNKIITKNIEVENVWTGDRLEYRPKNITFNLYQKSDTQKEQLVKQLKLSGEGNIWQGTFDYLPIYDKNGNRYSYNVEVDNNENLSNYRVSKSTDDEEVSKVTFTNQLKASIISARVDWEDLENEYGVRPTSVELILERSVDNNNFIAVGEKKVVTSPNWNYTFGVFPRYDAYNREYIYRVRQLNLPRLKNYLGENADSQALKDESGVFVIKNKINTIDIPINIVWDKDILPEKVTLSLTRTGSTPIPTYTKEVSGDKESKTWTTSFNNMVKYDLNGNEYVYTLKILNSDFSISSEENIQGVRTIILK